MKFRIFRTTSNRYENEKSPCPEAKSEDVMMSITQSSLGQDGLDAKKWVGPLPEFFLSWRGTNHRIEDGLFKRDEGMQSIFTIDFSDWSEFVAFGRKYGRLVVDMDKVPEYGLPTIEIYDDHRE